MILKYTENTEGLKIPQKTLDQNKVPCFPTIYIYGGTRHTVCVCVYIYIYFFFIYIHTIQENDLMHIPLFNVDKEQQSRVAC